MRLSRPIPIRAALLPWRGWFYVTPWWGRAVFQTTGSNPCAHYWMIPALLMETRECLFSQVVQSLVLARKVDVNGNSSSADEGTD